MLCTAKPLPAAAEAERCTAAARGGSEKRGAEATVAGGTASVSKRPKGEVAAATAATEHHLCCAGLELYGTLLPGARERWRAERSVLDCFDSSYSLQLLLCPLPPTCRNGGVRVVAWAWVDLLLAYFYFQGSHDCGVVLCAIIQHALEIFGAGTQHPCSRNDADCRPRTLERRWTCGVDA
jgi:hypothetical protein